jgi:hypothetical protein
MDEIKWHVQLFEAYNISQAYLMKLLTKQNNLDAWQPPNAYLSSDKQFAYRL